MLTKLILTNFLSFSERTEFDFTTSKYSILSDVNTYNNILKGAMFIGPNASGKTNALKGVGLLVSLIKGNGESIVNYRCNFSKSAISKIEYEFNINDKIISYKITYNVIESQLCEELTIDGTDVLTRIGSHGELRFNNYFTEENDLDGDTLFLRTASFNTGRFPQEPTLRSLMDFLFNSCYIDGYNRMAPLGNSINKYAEENGVDKINNYLEKFNYGFSVEYGNESEGEGLKIHMGSGVKSIFFKRNCYPIPNVFYMESQGNQVFADLLPGLISVIENSGMLIIDEFGNSFHNRLSEKIINFFMENSNDSQLFITSQDTNLISHSVFRPDQINLITFENSKGSKAKRISIFKPREAQNLEKMYLGGMFEGVPNYD